MNSYRELALYDLKSAGANYQFGLWNKVGRECQQACEKYLKHHLLQCHLLSGELERTHNLKKLFRMIGGYDRELYKELLIVSDYYFEANYPGDDFIELDRDMADEALDIAGRLIAYIDGLKQQTQECNNESH